MDTQIIFIQKVIGSNSTNEDAVTAWEKIPSNPKVWSKKEQKQGKEVVVSDQIQSVVNTTFVIDYREDLKESMRIVQNERVFNIISISDHEGSRKTYLIISADTIPNITWTE